METSLAGILLRMVTGNPKTSDPLQWSWRRFSDFGLNEWYAVTRLREAVFVVEQDCPYQDADGLDPAAWHLCGRYGNNLAAYLRLLPPELAAHPDIPAAVDLSAVAIGRVVVAANFRGRQLGRSLMLEGVKGSKTQFPGSIVQVSAQAHLRSFYTSLGFKTVTSEYFEDNIPHLGMHLIP